MRNKGQRGFTILELMISSFIVILALTAFLSTFRNLLKTADFSRGFSIASSACRSKLEEILNTDFSAIQTRYGPGSGNERWSFTSANPTTGIHGEGTVRIVKSATAMGNMKGDMVKSNSDPGWSPRRNHRAMNFQGKMWVMGGEAERGQTMADIWSSVNGGKDWIREKEAAPWAQVEDCYGDPDPNWKGSPFLPDGYVGRYSFGLVVGGVGGSLKAWITGGTCTQSPAYPWVKGPVDCDSPGESNFNQVWYSADGTNWTRAAQHADPVNLPNSDGEYTHHGEYASFPDVGRHASVITADGKIWVIGGRVTNIEGSCFEESKGVWYSIDGTTTPWTWGNKLPGDTYGHTALVFPLNTNNIYVLGGYTEVGYNMAVGNKVHISLNEGAWSTNTAQWSPRMEHASVVYSGRMWVLGGTNDSGTYYNDIWYSTNGTDWTKSCDANWSPRSGLAAIEYNGKLCIMGGYNPTEGFMSDVWCHQLYSDSALEITITVCWTDASGHTYGEDKDLDGVLDAGEDQNNNTEIDSPVQLKILLTENNLPYFKRTFLGRP